MLCTHSPLFTIADMADYNDRCRQSRTEISDASFEARLSWNEGFDYQTVRLADCLFLISDGGFFTSPHMTLPVGPLDLDRLQRIMDTIEPVFRKRNWPVRCLYIDRDYLSLFQQLRGYRVRLAYDRIFSDYLYDTEALRQLSGKSLHAKRNHFNRFLRTYPDYEYRTLTAADRDEALALVAEWCREKQVDCQNLRSSDYPVIRQLFNHFDELQLRGGQIRIDGRLAAFAIGSRTGPDSGVIHIEKARAEYAGLYAAINKLVLDHEFADVRWINREEDLGISGLRKAKLSYGPARLIHKYEAILTREVAPIIHDRAANTRDQSLVSQPADLAAPDQIPEGGSGEC